MYGRQISGIPDVLCGLVPVRRAGRKPERQEFLMFLRLGLSEEGDEDILLIGRIDENKEEEVMLCLLFRGESIVTIRSFTLTVLLYYFYVQDQGTDVII